MHTSFLHPFETLGRTLSYLRSAAPPARLVGQSWAAKSPFGAIFVQGVFTAGAKTKIDLVQTRLFLHARFTHLYKYRLYKYEIPPARLVGRVWAADRN